MLGRFAMPEIREEKTELDDLEQLF